MQKKILTLAETLGDALKGHALQLTVAESCTGGSLAAALTSISGSSAWFDRGFVTYSNHAKQEILGVSEYTLSLDGAVSEPTVRAMAEGAILESDASVSVAISGIAGPLGGTKEKPVGTVWIAFAGARQPTKAIAYTFPGNREAVREAAVIKALQGLIKRVQNYQPPSTEAAAYFFALMPDPPTRKKLHLHAESVTQHTDYKPILTDNVHLTLHYLGALHPKELEQLMAFDCTVAPFELTVNKAAHWPNNHVAYLKPQYSSPLKKLHHDVSQYLLTLGLKPERRTFKPHITLAKHYMHPLKPYTFPPIHWFVHELCLVQSSKDASVAPYEVLKRIPLTLKTC